MSAPLRVAFVDHSSERGGAELALARLLQTSQDWLVTLIVPRARVGSDDAYSNLEAGIKVVRAGPRHAARKTGRGGPLSNIALALRIVGSALHLALTPSVRASGVMVANTTRASVYVAIASVLLRKPFVVHIRDLIEPVSIGSTATGLMRKLVLPRAAAVIANSQTSLNLVETYLKPECVRAVIPSPSGLVVLPVDEVAVSPTVSRVGMVARLDPWKGQELLIEAFSSAFPDSDVKLVLFGGPSFGHDDFKERLLALADSRGVLRRVEFAGHVDDVDAAIRSLDICVQCSTRPEPLGQNVLQYLAAGKPTIVANEGGPAEWIRDGENGLTFIARDRESLTRALRAFDESRQLRSSVALAAIGTPRLLEDSSVSDEIYSVLHDVNGA